MNNNWYKKQKPISSLASLSGGAGGMMYGGGGGSGSVEFDGASGTYLNLAASTDFQWSGDFTLECWFNPDTIADNRGIFNLGAYNVSGGFELLTQTNGRFQLYGHDGSNASSWIETSTGIMSTGNWYHLAMVRSGSTVTLYLGGSSKGTVTKSHTFGAGSNNSFVIGAGYAGSYMEYFDGTISNVRLTKGQALYTSNFTPPTEELTTTSQSATESNVKLLCCQSATSVTEAAVSPGTITANGGVSATSDVPF